MRESARTTSQPIEADWTCVPRSPWVQVMMESTKLFAAVQVCESNALVASREPG